MLFVGRRMGSDTIRAVHDNQGNLTQLLRDASSGDADALEALIPIVYQQLHRLARNQMRRERAGHTLNTTGLVHEAFLRLSRQNNSEWLNRDQFLAVASLTMRRVLVDWARGKARHKRRGEITPFADDILPKSSTGLDPEQILSIDQALDRLASVSPRVGRVVECRYFSGLTVDETAAALRVSAATVKREWRFAKTWLKRELTD